MKIEIEFESREDLQKQIAELLGASLKTEVSATTEAVETVGELTQSRGRGRPPKEKVVEKKPEPVKEEPKPEPPIVDIGFDEPSPQVTLEDFKKAFQVAVASKGVDHCRKVLAEFGVQKATEIQPDNYAKVMEKLK
jgi:hypothetical protein